MKNPTTILRLLGLAILLLFPSRTFASTSLREFYIRQALDRYFELPEDARTLSMASSSGPDCRTSGCIFLNPAGLGVIPNIELSTTLGFSIITGEELFSENELEQSEYHGYFAAAFPLGEIVDGRPLFGTIDFAYSRYDGHTDDTIHTTPDGHRRSIAYGIAPFDWLSLGYAFNFYDDQLRSEIADLHSHSRLLHTWGLQYRPEESLDLSALFKLGIGQSDTSDFRFDSNGLSHLRSYTGVIGIAKQFDEFNASASFDYTRVQSRGNLGDGEVAVPVVIGGSEEGNVYNIRAGVEKTFVGGFALRAGLRWQEIESYKFRRPDLEQLSGSVEGLGFSVGAGYTIRTDPEAKPTITFDYGAEYVSIGRGTWEHLLTATVPL